MKIHPGISMLLTWGIALTIFFVLPFQLETRQFTAYGFVVLAGFIAAFVGASFLGSPVMPERTAPFTRLLDFTAIDRLLMIVAAVASVAMIYDILNGNVLDLNAAFQERNDRSLGAITGSATGGSLAFQVAFLLYPAGFIAIARELMFRQRLKLVQLGLVGFGPLVLASLAMGGRGPILYSLVLAALCLRQRKKLFPRGPEARRASRGSLEKFATYVVGGIVALVAMNYFVEVFVARAEVAGGVEQMQKIAALNWGVSFDGPGSEFLRSTIGEGNTYLVYVFIWYGVQGIVMANTLFSQFDGHLTYGIYGLDLGTALARRIDPGFVADRLAPLVQLNIYGFLPSAFGSIFVDFGFLGLLPIAVWGYLAGVVYRRIHTSADARWMLVGPFVTMGIIFSLINTPLGFGNGLMIHFWLLVSVVLIRPLENKLPRFAIA